MDADQSSRYDAAAEALISLFTKIDRAAGTLPPFTYGPAIQITWASLKFSLAFFGDMLLIVFINIFILIRNQIFKKRNYVCWTCKYIKKFLNWIWQGECAFPFIHIQPLTTFFLHLHFRNRLSLLRRQLLLDSGFSEDYGKSALAKIDRASAFWATTTFGSIVLVWVLPAVGPALEIIKWLAPANLPAWSTGIVFVSIGYVISCLIASFGVKRGLLLGASANAALYPGFLPEAAGYEYERKILEPLGIRTSEFPVDAALIAASVVLGMISFKAEMEAIHDFGWASDPPPYSPSVNLVVVTIFYAVIVGVALTRRRKLGRL